MSNRQLLCRACHDRKTRDHSREAIRLADQGRPAGLWSDLLRELVRSSEPIRALIAQRILPQEPVRFCDTDEWQHHHHRLKSERYRRLKELLEDLFDGEVPHFGPHTPWRERMDQARDYHSMTYDEGPCTIDDCPECSGKDFGGRRITGDPGGHPSYEAWLDDPDVHVGYGPGSYFAEAMATDD